jgi:hypothetical protein
MGSVVKGRDDSLSPTSISLTALQIAGSALLFFHGWLLWERMSAGELLQPPVALRWAAALPLALAWIAHRRRGLSPFRGRRALVLWLLAALLHWHGGATTDDSVQPAWLIAAPVVSLVSVGLILTSSRIRPRRSPLAHLRRILPDLDSCWPTPRVELQRLPRPPPA